MAGLSASLHSRATSRSAALKWSGHLTVARGIAAHVGIAAADID